MAAAGAAGKKKFATCNLNQVLGAPKATSPKNHGPAVRSAAVIKPVAKPKGLISLGKAPPGSNIHTRKGAAWSQLEEKAKERREEEDARKDDLAKPEWAILDYEDLDKPLTKPEFAEDGAELKECTDGEEHSDNEDVEDQFAREAERFPEPVVHVTMRTADTSEAASQTIADDTDLNSARGERQFSKSQRSYLSMEYNPAVTGEEVLGAAEQHASMQVSPMGGFGVDLADLDARRLRTRSWADQYGSDDDEPETFPASIPSAGETPSASSSTRPFYKAPASQPVGAVPTPTGPPPPRRPPPPGPPPPAQSEVARTPGRVGGPPRPAGPPPPMPPPAGPPAALRGAPARPGAAPGPPEPDRAPGGAVEGRQGAQEVQRQRSPKFSPQEDPVVHAPQLSRHDARFQGPKSPPHEGSRHVEQQQRWKQPTPQAAQEEQHHSYSYSSSHVVDNHNRDPRDIHNRDPTRLHSARDEGRRETGGPGPKAQGAWGRGEPRHPLGTEANRPRPPPGSAPIGHAPGPADGCWGPAVAYTPAFAPRAPPDRPMSEDFANSGWKEKKLWSPPEAEKPATGRNSQAPGSATAGGPRSRLRGEAAPPGHGVSETSPGGAAGGRRAAGTGPEEAAEPVHPPKPPKPPKAPKGPLEALDPDSSSSDESDGPGLPPEYAVLDMNVPRTALVINVSHVLKRLNGCCSLNQLTKSIKSFKDNTGVTLEAFLRANPMTFKLEGRIVHLLGRDGEKWKPPEEAGDQNDFGKGKGKGKGEAAKGGRGAETSKKRSGGGSGQADDQWDSGSAYYTAGSKAADWDAGAYRSKYEVNDPWDSGEGRARGKGEGRKQRSSGTNGNASWSSSGWSEWQAGGWQSDRGWQHW